MECFVLKSHLFFVLLCVFSIECGLQSLHETESTVITGDKELIDKVLTWACPFSDSDKNFNESKNWQNFLNKLFCKLSEYKIQVAKRKYRVNNTVNLVKKDCEIELIEEVQRTEIDENNVKRFLNKTVKCNLTEYDSFKNIEITGKQIEELNDVLNFTLRDRLHVNCEERNVYIKGNYLITGDIIDILQFKRNLTDAKCENLLLTDKNKFVNIFALNTFFIDISINSSLTNSHKISLMSVIAPKWENTGKNKIELKGEDAKLPAVENGMDGKPGNAGSPGGNFFGIGSQFVNGIHLEISVSGGSGSHGQGGRKGENGIDGKSPTPPSNIPCNDYYCDRNIKISDFNCKKIQCKSTYYAYPGVDTLDWCEYEMLGEKGTKGKNGGKGGKGGIGGYPGNIELIELKSYSDIHLLQNTGQNGTDGQGGAGGLGGRKGNDMTVKCRRTCGFFTSNCWYVVKTKTSNERDESGQNGIDGSNTQGMDNPKLAVVINKLDKAKIINEYKSYLRENLHGRFTNVFLNDFLNHLETSTNVKNVYSTLALIDELQHLEDQFHKLNADINFIPFYRSLLNRISEYAYAPKEAGDPRLYKKVLCYLYTAVLSRIHNMEDNLESNLIIDIYAYLNSVKNDIDKITDLKNSNYKEKLINKYKREYKREIDIKINEAKELISKEITPEIRNVGTEMDTEIETLVDEVIYFQKEAINEHTIFIKKQQELKSALVQQGIFSVYKIVGAVVSFLGPLGAVAGSVIKIGSTVGESFISNNADDQNKILVLPQSVSEIQSINNKVKNIINQRISRLRNSLEGITLEITMHSDISSNMSFKILGIKDKLDKLDQNKFNFKEIQSLENGLDAALQIQEEKSDPKNTQHTVLKKNWKNIVELRPLLSDLYSKYKNNRDKLDAISTAIGQNEANLKKLQQYEQKIYNHIIPMLQNIQSDLQDIIDKLGTKSKMALDVTKWHVGRTLRGFVLLMHQLTQGFEVKGNLARCLEKLKEALDALIGVHQHIQDYQRDQNLANYIAEISSIAVTDIIVANNAVLQETLRNAVRKLEITVRSNIVLHRYKIAMNAFKQFVFPFAHNYFKDLIPPLHLTVSDNKTNVTLEDLVSKASVELEKMNSKLEDYKNTVTNRDGCIGIGEFQSGYVSSKPFFVWRNEQYNNMISKLLSGNVVMVKADVRNSAPDKDAIKFNVIDFNFKSRNKTLQNEIDNKLKGFQITVNHLGNSDYRYDHKIYEMTTGSQEIWYYFEKKANGEPVYYSLSYKKIMHGNVTLSPYASWKIKLDNVTDDISLKDLEIYKNSVDLTLEGYGYFLNKRSRHCVDLMVDTYYKAIDTFYNVNKSDNLYPWARDNVYPFQGNLFKSFKVFKGFS